MDTLNVDRGRWVAAYADIETARLAYATARGPSRLQLWLNLQAADARYRGGPPRP